LPIKLLPLLLLTASTVAASDPPPDDKAPRRLIELRNQLFDAGKSDALRDMPRFRPLCDEAGYPLVGNAVRKGDVYQPSQFCAEVRKAGKSGTT
jgi:hypothetical protein